MQERDGRIGYWISGATHGALILWAILGGALFRPQPSEPVRTTQVSTISGAEFAAMAAASRGAGPVGAAATEVDSLRTPVEAEDGTAPPLDAAPPQSADAVVLAAPDAAEALPDLTDLAPSAPVEVATDLSAPTLDQTEAAEAPPAIPEPPPAPVAEASPVQPAMPVPDAAATPVAPRSVLALDASPRPQDRPADLVENYNRRVAAAAAAEAARQAAAEAAAQQAAAEVAAAQQAAAEAAAQAAEERRAAEAAEQAAEERRAAEAAEQAAEERRAAEAAEQAAEERRAAEAAAQAAEERRAAEAAEQAAEERRAAEAAEQAAEERRAAEAAEQAAEERRAAEAAEERRAAEAAEQAAEERRAAEAAEERRAAEAAEQAAEERRAAEAAEQAAEERRAAEAAEQAAEERRAAEAAEQAAEERRAAEAAAQAAEERRAAEAAAQAAEERRAAEVAREAADRQALEDALREAQAGVGNSDAATTGDAFGGDRQMIEGGSGASAGMDPLAAALAEAMSGGQAPAEAQALPDALQLVPGPLRVTPLADPSAGLPMGEPLSMAERDGLRFAIQNCWNLGALSVEAARMTVSVGLTLSPDGVPEQDSLRLAGFQGGSESGAQQAFEVARRAILMCGRAGFDLPASKYGRWRDVVVDFRPDGVGF